MKDVNVEFMRLEMKKSDFEEDADADDIWGALAHRSERRRRTKRHQSHQTVLQSLSVETMGISIFPKERAHILDALHSASRTLKEEEATSVPTSAHMCWTHFND